MRRLLYILVIIISFSCTQVNNPTLNSKCDNCYRSIDIFTLKGKDKIENKSYPYYEISNESNQINFKLWLGEKENIELKGEIINSEFISKNIFDDGFCHNGVLFTYIGNGVYKEVFSCIDSLPDMGIITQSTFFDFKNKYGYSKIFKYSDYSTRINRDIIYDTILESKIPVGRNLNVFWNDVNDSIIEFNFIVQNRFTQTKKTTSIYLSKEAFNPMYILMYNKTRIFKFLEL